jgi:hypothetical protein
MSDFCLKLAIVRNPLMLKEAILKSIIWWSILVICVLGVAGFSLIVTTTLARNQLSESALFVLTCWWCVHYGLRALKDADVRNRLGLDPAQKSN